MSCPVPIPSQKVLQGDRSPAGPRVLGCGYRLRHLRGGGQVAQQRLEDPIGGPVRTPLKEDRQSLPETIGPDISTCHFWKLGGLTDERQQRGKKRPIASNDWFCDT